MKLSETDRREFCSRCGWVGRRAFQRDRHDLCETSEEVEVAKKAVTAAEDSDAEDDHAGVDEEEDVDEEDVTPRWGRAAARRRGIPPKKTVAARRITQVELQVGRAELKMLGADGPYERPKTRGDCQWCSVCQLVRDGKSSGLDRAAFRAFGRDPIRGDDREESSVGSSVRLSSGNDISRTSPSRLGQLACGHRITEVIYHSRPCVFVACKHALFLDTSETGSLIFNFPHLTPNEMRPDQSCSLDLADRGGMTLEEIAVVTNLTRERIRQVELKTLIRRARPAALSLGLRPEDAADAGMKRGVGPGADLAETGVDGEVPSDVATILAGNGGNNNDK